MASKRIFRYICLVFLLYVLFNSLYVRRRDAISTTSPRFHGEKGLTGIRQYVRSSYDWSRFKPHHQPSTAPTSLPSVSVKSLPRIQYDFSHSSDSRGSSFELRRLEVKRAFQKCWKSYRRYAWMKDELEPVTGKGKTTFGGWGATLFDSLDTLWIMGFEKEFKEAVKAVAQVDWAKTEATSVNVFETTIRFLGGLLSAYDLSGERILLLKAIELGDMLLAAFDRPNYLPGFWFDFENAKNGKQRDDQQLALAAPASLSLEFTRLSQLTENSKYYGAIDRVMNLLAKHQNFTLLPGMWPNSINFDASSFTKHNKFSIGSSADSAYEYLPKMHALLGGMSQKYLEMTNFSFLTIVGNILYRPSLPNQEDILFASTVHTGMNNRVIPSHDMEHLSCFAGGMFALGGRLIENATYVDIGRKLTDGCIWAYNSFPSGIMPEDLRVTDACPTFKKCDWKTPTSTDWNKYDPVPGVKAGNSDYLLRPEAIESVFVLYRITGNEEYREDAWRMFNAIMNSTSTEYGNSAVTHVDFPNEMQKRNSMESFWLAETLKYFYLIFSPPDFISLDEYVFNTEAHPFRLTRPA